MTTGVRRGWSWSRTAALVRARDQVCRWCGGRARLEVDHIVEVRHGGTDHPSNLRALCHDCHERRTRAGQLAADQLVRRHYPEYLRLAEAHGTPRAPRW